MKNYINIIITFKNPKLPIIILIFYSHQLLISQNLQVLHDLKNQVKYYQASNLCVQFIYSSNTPKPTQFQQYNDGRNLHPKPSEN